MNSIAVHNQTKIRLDFAIQTYIKDKQLPKDLEKKLSYDFIINQILDKVGVTQ